MAENKSRLRGIADIVKGTAKKFGAENGPLIAAAISFYALLSLIPLLLLAVSLFGYVIGSSDKAFKAVSGFFAQVTPSPGFVTSTLHDLVRQRGVIGLIGLVALLWTGSQFFVILQNALDDVWEVVDKPGFIKARLKAILLVLVFGAFLVLSVVSSSLASLVHSALASPKSGVLATLLSIGAILLGLVFSIIMFTVMYKYVPTTRVDLRPALAGGIFAGVVWTIAKELYRVYLGFANFNAAYGSLGSVVILILWIYYSSVITVFGGELVYVSEHGPRDISEEEERMKR